jgi:hypothetical protein
MERGESTKIAAGTVFDHLDPIGSAVAVHDIPHTHIILGFTLDYIASLRGINEPTAAIEHRERAFNLIQDRWELIGCNPQAFSVHMSGLHQMIIGRGGIELQTILLRFDAIRA